VTLILSALKNFQLSLHSFSKRPLCQNTDAPADEIMVMSPAFRSIRGIPVLGCQEGDQTFIYCGVKGCGYRTLKKKRGATAKDGVTGRQVLTKHVLSVHKRE